MKLIKAIPLYERMDKIRKINDPTKFLDDGIFHTLYMKLRRITVVGARMINNEFIETSKSTHKSNK